jgi:hypothetical protein
MRYQRAFVVDPMCALSYGHNQASVALFRRALLARFSECIALVPTALPEAAAQEKGFTRCLNYPYNTSYYLRFQGLLMSRVLHPRLRAGFELWLRRGEKVGLSTVARLSGIDLVLNQTRRNWSAQFRRFKMAAGDLIFFPSTDYYGAAACLDHMLSQPASKRPRLHLRMICVMEHASISSPSACDLLMERVRRAVAAGVEVGVSAETPAYAAYLGRRYGVQAAFFPQPLSGDAMPMPAGQPRVVAAIGSGRGDKGYFLMPEIAGKTAERCGNRVSFEFQRMPRQDHGFSAAYEASLATVPNLRVLPAVLSAGELLDGFRRSYVALLPYDPKTFEHRGSAIFQEAIAFARPVVCLAGAAFAELTSRYSNGYACADVDGMARAIAECVAIAPEEWQQRLAVSRARYEADVNLAMAEVFGGAAMV